MAKKKAARKASPRRKPVNPPRIDPEEPELGQAAEADVPLQGIFKYRAKRDCYYKLRYVRQGEVIAVNIGIVGPPPHHFEPMDGGPAGPPPKIGPWARPEPARAMDGTDPGRPMSLYELRKQGFTGKPIGAEQLTEEQLNAVVSVEE